MSELSELTAQRDNVMAELAEIEALSEEGRSRILEAIKTQRWFFFRNNKYILMDRDTGLLWANLDYFNYQGGNIGNFDEVSGIIGWVAPHLEQLRSIASNHKNPFNSGNGNRIKKSDWYRWRISSGSVDIDTFSNNSDRTGWLFPCNPSLIANTTYAQDVDPNSKVYSETQRLQFTLDLFTQNNLWPIFTDDEITQLYGKLYFDKPALTAKLQELNEQIAPLMAVRVLSSEFDYTSMLAQYDLPAVNSSVIKYFETLKNWTDSLMAMLEDYEREKDDTVRQFGVITLKLSKKYQDSPALLRDENNLLRERLAFFLRKLSLGMNTVKAKILAVKRQAVELEDRIDSTDSTPNLQQYSVKTAQHSPSSLRTQPESSAMPSSR